MAKETEYPLLSKERQKRAISFIENLSDPYELRYVLDSISDTIRNHIHKAIEDSKSEKEETISQLCYLTDVYDALVYISINNPCKKKEE